MFTFKTLKRNSVDCYECVILSNFQLYIINIELKILFVMKNTINFRDHADTERKECSRNEYYTHKWCVSWKKQKISTIISEIVKNLWCNSSKFIWDKTILVCFLNIMDLTACLDLSWNESCVWKMDVCVTSITQKIFHKAVYSQLTLFQKK